MIRHCLLMFAFLFPFMSFTTQAQEGGLFQEVEFHTELQMQRYTSLVNELRCLVCQNQSIADSDADLANQLRAEVQTMILDNRSDQEIVQYMVDRYGDFVLFDPPLKWVTSILWFGPLLFLAIGLGYLYRQIRARSTSTAAESGRTG